MIPSHTPYSAGNWKVRLVLWLNTTAASTSGTLSHSPPPEQVWGYSLPGIWILLKPFNEQTEKGEGSFGNIQEEFQPLDFSSSGRTTALQEAISFTRSITSWLNVVGQKTWDTRPRLQASCAVSFLPQNSISLACRLGKIKEQFMLNVDAVNITYELSSSETWCCCGLPELHPKSGGRCKKSSQRGWGGELHMEFGTRLSHWPKQHHTVAG